MSRMMSYERLAVRAACLAVVVSLVGVGCGLVGGGVEHRTVEDDGRVCLTSQSGGGSEQVQPGILRVEVGFDACLSSSCDTVEEKSCHVTVSGETITVHSSATIKREGLSCTDDCGFVETTCLTPALEEGDYTLVHGDEQMEFSLPSDGEICGPGQSPVR